MNLSRSGPGPGPQNASGDESASEKLSSHPDERRQGRPQAQQIRWARPGAAWQWASPAHLRVNLAASASALCNA
jgi:hypothetical protein